jgi:hypothetical protein
VYKFSGANSVVPAEHVPVPVSTKAPSESTCCTHEQSLLCLHGAFVKQSLVHVDGQGPSLQTASSVLPISGVQGLPPCAAAVVSVKVRTLTPSPQDAEHGSNAEYSPAQCTAAMVGADVGAEVISAPL